jgi:hypothetical protein
VRIVQRKSGDGVLTFDCSGYGTPSLRGIPLTSQYGNASPSSWKFRIHQSPTDLLSLTISKTSNIVYDRSCVRVRALVKHILILMFDVKKVGIIYSGGICNGR